MRSGNRGRKIDDAQTGKTPRQIPLIATGYRHSLSSLEVALEVSLGPSARWFSGTRRDPKLRMYGREAFSRNDFAIGALSYQRIELDLFLHKS
jgi:hypothetical protein